MRFLLLALLPSLVLTAMLRTVLITGASRGIGLGLVKQFLADDSYFVVACARSPSASLDALKQTFSARLALEQLDVTSKTDFDDIAKKYECIDIVIANAGISNKQHPVDLILNCSVEDMMATFETNCVGTLLTMQAFTTALINSKSKVKVFSCISSRLASIEQNTYGGYTSYRASKAALNQLVKTYDSDASVRGNGIVSILVHPGWVQTDMGGGYSTYSINCLHTHSFICLLVILGSNGRKADIEVDESVQGIYRVIHDVIEVKSGVNKSELAQFQYIKDSSCLFLGFNHERLPW